MNATINLDSNVNIWQIILNRDVANIFPVLSMVGILFALVFLPVGVFVYGIAPVYLLMRWLKDTRSHTDKQKKQFTTHCVFPE